MCQVERVQLLCMLCTVCALTVYGRSIIQALPASTQSGSTVHSLLENKDGGEELSDLHEVIYKKIKSQLKLNDNFFWKQDSKVSTRQFSDNGLVRGKKQLQSLPGITCTKTGRCQPCRQCGPHEVAVIPCTSSRDTVCIQLYDSAQYSLCVRLLKRKEIQLKKDWPATERITNHHWLRNCSRYFARLPVDLRRQLSSEDILGTERKTKSFHKRDAGSDRRVNEQENIQSLKMTSSAPLRNTTTKWKPQVLSSNGTEQGIVTTVPNKWFQMESSSTGTAPWVFITIGVAVFILIALVTLLIIYNRRRKLSSGSKALKKGGNATLTNNLIKNSLGSGLRDMHVVDTGIDSVSGARSFRQGENYETVPLRTISSRDISQSEEFFLDRASYAHERATVHHPYATVINKSEPAADSGYCRLLSCISVEERETNVKKALSSSSLFSTRQDDGNKLKGGNGDFQRRYVDMDFVNDIDLPKRKYRAGATRSTDLDSQPRRSSFRRFYSQSSDQEYHRMASNYRSSSRARNGSNTSSSARSYISIPPTSPSENYIEAGSDNISMRSERSTPPVKTAWLTKNLKVDARNELHNYQTSLGTQTESDSDVTAPKCKTVFGTPWQFGGTFTSQGGVLQAKDSDVCLVVGANAVTKAEYVDIYGAVFTDTVEIRKKLDFPAKESLITPVVEYHAVPFSTFNKHVCVQLPHALPEEFDVSLIKVYTFTVDELGKVTLYTVPMSGKENYDRRLETYWEKGSDGCSVFINTTHFSGYFCTVCKTSSLPSICTMVFGSHVQITPSRREVRVILYIWDRRLTIKDYLERFRKEESDVDRQLLTDMQVPLLNDASSDSRLLMKMEVMGEDEDRQSWRHVSRPDGSRPLFRPLQARKLRDIVHCCRQTDPIRVEWALENAPRQIPSTVFQCCIDIMHVHESTSDFETAMREGSDELLRTFYVRDLKVMTHSSQELRPHAHIQLGDLKKILLEITNMPQMEKICQEFGITVKDIGNFKKKHTTVEACQVGLVEECLNRHGMDKFMTQLPCVLERLNLIHVLTALENRKVFYKVDKDTQAIQSDPETCVQHKVTCHITNPDESDGDGVASTLCKTPYSRRPSSPSHRNKSSSPVNSRSREDTRRKQKSDFQHQLSEKSDDVFVLNNPLHHNTSSDDRCERNVGGEEPWRYSRLRHNSPPSCQHVNSEENLAKDHTVSYTGAGDVWQNNGERQVEKIQKSSYSRSDSVLTSTSLSSPDNQKHSSHFSSRSTLGSSLVAHEDPLDFAEPYPDEMLDDDLQQTYKKEIAVQRNVFGPFSGNDSSCLYNRDRHNLSNCGPYALPPLSGTATPYRKSQKDNRERSQSQENDQTRKKETYGMHTVV